MSDKQELGKKILEIYLDRWEGDPMEYDKIEIIDEGDWTQDYKYQHNSTIVKYEGVFYSIDQSRSGSYHTDWYYNPAEIYEVIPEEVVIKRTEYKVVGNGSLATVDLD